MGKDGLVLNRANGKTFDEEDIEQHLQSHDDFYPILCCGCIKKGISVQKIYDLSAIDLGSLKKLKIL